MTLNLYSLTKSRHETVNRALRTGGDSVLGKARVRSYLSRALQYQPSADHEIRRAALLEALSINLSPYIWITVSKSLYAKRLSLEFHFRRVSTDTPPTVPPHLDALLIALASNANTTARVPTINIIDQNGHLHYAKAFSDGTYTHLPLDPSYKGDAAQVQDLQALVNSIFSLAHTQDAFVTDPYDGMTRRTSWSKNPAWHGQTAKDWYGHKRYKTLIAAMADTFIYPGA